MRVFRFRFLKRVIVSEAGNGLLKQLITVCGGKSGGGGTGLDYDEIHPCYDGEPPIEAGGLRAAEMVEEEAISLKEMALKRG